MSDIDFESRFPDMRPIKSLPSLSTINGIGPGMCGSRDYDPETQTYVSTQCFCILFIPVLALAAYRVADAHPGWYFLGRVPLSKFAKNWNIFLLVAVLGLTGFGFWHSHAQSPEYIAGRRLAEADRLAAAGRLGNA